MSYLDESPIVDTTSLLKNDIEDSLLKPQIKKMKKIKIMKTPCKHKFHVKCLNEWMVYSLNFKYFIE